jgi:hypothetical protein
VEISLKWTNLYTNTGKFNKNCEKPGFVSILGENLWVGEESLGNIRRNFLGQGKIFMGDFEMHMEIFSSRDRTDVWRVYFTVLDVFSGLGVCSSFCMLGF